MNEPEQREEVVFEAALRLTDHQRAAYLDQACGGDTELRRRVDALLGAFARAGGFLKEPAPPSRTPRPLYPGLPRHPARASKGGHPPRHQALEHSRHATRRRARAEGD